MTRATLRKTGLLLLIFIITGCAGGDSSSDYKSTTTVKDLPQVVAGLVYGNTGKQLSSITGEEASPLPIYTSIESGQYAIIDYPLRFIARENIFSATFSDGSSLYSVWSGVPTPLVDVTVTYNQQGTLNPSFVNVSPDNFAARANINPITDLAYWYWLYDNKQSPYGYNFYLTSVFLFFNRKYSIPWQNAVHDYPSPELLRLFTEIKIQMSTDATGFSLISNSTGNTICTATFAQFPICH